MAVARCHLCTDDPEVRRLYGRQGLTDGSDCPICYRPTCAYHLSVVRWRWRDGGEVTSARICQACKRSYAHRHWDAANREWIS